MLVQLQDTNPRLEKRSYVPHSGSEPSRWLRIRGLVIAAKRRSYCSWKIIRTGVTGVEELFRWTTIQKPDCQTLRLNKLSSILLRSSSNIALSAADHGARLGHVCTLPVISRVHQGRVQKAGRRYHRNIVGPNKRANASS